MKPSAITPLEGTALRSYSRRLLSYVRKISSGEVQAFMTPEDIVMETFNYAFENRDRWKDIPEKDLIFFLMRVARIRTLNHCRRYKYRKTVQKDDSNSSGQDPVDSQMKSPSKQVHAGEKHRALIRIMDRLQKSEYREILRLIWIEGLTHKQAGAKLGLSEIGSRGLLFRAMEACRSIARRESFAGFRVSGETT